MQTCSVLAFVNRLLDVFVNSGFCVRRSSCFFPMLFVNDDKINGVN